MIHDYFEHRSYLGNLHSVFQCDHACSRPGCTHPDMQVPVTAFDIVGAAIHRSEPIQEVFQNNYYLGVLDRDGFDWIKSVSLKLKKPCPFLDHQRCSIYKVRPLSCILFPEHQAVEGTLKSLTAQPHYKDYLCLKSPFSVPKQRVQTIRTLARMFQHERVVSDSTLFFRSPFWIDFSNCVEELARQSRGTTSHKAQDTQSVSCVTIPLASFEVLFNNTFARCTPLAELEARIRGLADCEQQKKMFSDLNESNRLKSLAHGDLDPSYVSRYVNGRLHVRRKSLIPLEVMFLW
jgi:Fe-S-cluster containining protein